MWLSNKNLDLVHHPRSLVILRRDSKDHVNETMLEFECGDFLLNRQSLKSYCIYKSTCIPISSSYLVRNLFFTEWVERNSLSVKVLAFDSWGAVKGHQIPEGRNDLSIKTEKDGKMDEEIDRGIFSVIQLSILLSNGDRSLKYWWSIKHKIFCKVFTAKRLNEARRRGHRMQE